MCVFVCEREREIEREREREMQNNNQLSFYHIPLTQMTFMDRRVIKPELVLHLELKRLSFLVFMKASVFLFPGENIQEWSVESFNSGAFFKIYTISDYLFLWEIGKRHLYWISEYWDYQKRWLDIIAVHTGNSLGYKSIADATNYIEYRLKGSSSLFWHTMSDFITCNV